MAHKVIMSILLAIILSACTTNNTNSTTTPAKSEATPNNNTRTIATTTTSTPLQPVPTSVFSNRYEITDKDNGRTFTYQVTSRFLINLNQTVAFTCRPDNKVVIGGIASEPYVEPPYYLRRFEGISEGTCVFFNEDYKVTIHIK